MLFRKARTSAAIALGSVLGTLTLVAPTSAAASAPDHHAACAWLGTSSYGYASIPEATACAAVVGKMARGTATLYVFNFRSVVVDNRDDGKAVKVVLHTGLTNVNVSEAGDLPDTARSQDAGTDYVAARCTTVTADLVVNGKTKKTLLSAKVPCDAGPIVTVLVPDFNAACGSEGSKQGLTLTPINYLWAGGCYSISTPRKVGKNYAFNTNAGVIDRSADGNAARLELVVGSRTIKLSIANTLKTAVMKFSVKKSITLPPGAHGIIYLRTDRGVDANESIQVGELTMPKK